MNPELNFIQIEPTRRPSVLLIENTLDGELIEMVLQDAGFNVWHARDLAEARKAVRCFRADVIMAGWGTKGPDGPVIVEKLKAEHLRLQNLPVILMSECRLSVMTRHNLTRMGVKWVLEKPLVPTSLPSLVRETIRGRRSAFESTTFARQVEFGQTASSALLRCVV